MFVWGETKEIHDQRLHKVLAKIKESGLKLDQSKCLFGVTELTFIGHVISAEGVKLDPKKIEAITAMPVPTTKVVLQRFLGMVNYLGKFIPNPSDKTAPLRALLRNETEFLMQKPQLDSFEKLKRLISLVPVLQFFNPNLSTRIRTDSSSVGLQKYDFKFNYSPGKTMKVANALSRASLDDAPEINANEMAHHVHSIINQIYPSK